MERLTYYNEALGVWTYKCASGDAAIRLKEYEDTGMTPDEVLELLGTMKGACVLCGLSHDDPTADAPKINGCRYTECGCHRWRGKWWKEESENA